MEESSRSVNLHERDERKRRPSGCLILKKKVDVMSNGVYPQKQRGIESKEKKRPRLILSDSDSADDDDRDLLVSPPSKLIRPVTTPDISSVRNSFHRQFEIEIDRKRKSASVVHNEDSRTHRNKSFDSGIERNRDRNNDVGYQHAGIERKKSRVDDIRYSKDEKFGKGLLKKGLDDRRTDIRRNGVLVSKSRIPSEFDSSRSIPLEDRVQKSKLSVDRERDSISMDRQKLKMKKYGSSLLRETFEPHRSEPIRVQGKNGVLKVMPKHNVAASYTPKREEENGRGSTLAAQSKGKTHLSSPLDSENRKSLCETSVVVTEKEEVNSLKKFKRNDIDGKRKEESGKPKKLSSTHNDRRTEGSETSLPQESKDVVTCNSKKEVSNTKQESLESGPCVPTRRKEGEVKRGNGTEKQLLREQIRQMLVNAGWRIDLRPRRNRDYQDSVYVNPSGTEYWSITKAYNAFQKQFEEEHKDQKHGEKLSPFTPIPADVLGKLTRKTRRKMEREIEMQQKADRGSKNPKETSEKNLKKKRVKTDSGMSEENSDVMQDGKLLKVKIKRNSGAGLNTDDLDRRKKCDVSKAGSGNGVLKKQRGRALLVRNSSKGLNLGDDDDDFVPYKGKRTVLSWLIDMETVRLSAKVQYMNKKRTRAMLEGWITRDGIHCGCCSKILTISKFELHAGSKLHHPFLNIIVEDGVSLYQCQLDAWNRQDKSVRRGYHFIDVNGDDPNDDTCGICGDGGDLICCDGCPSTFHQSCLDIQMLPSGDWLCPNCSCKFCGGVDGCTGQDEDNKLSSCSLCEAKYHQLCRQQVDATSVDCDSLSISFCGEACKELFQKLQKLLGVKHELEAGFSWTLIQRSNLDSDASSRGQCRKAEWNSKIAVALTVMDECFLPFIDQRTGVNLIHNVLFNIGSNFNRLNYSGFYTAVLERGDEIIAAASIRIHGTRLAEMPFIGTRHIYRRQGMCRRLLHAIESALSSLNVEKLVIPAISELMQTWTTVFGFRPLEESERKDVKTLNMLVFPSTDLLQKPLLKHKSNEVVLTESSVVKVIAREANNNVMHEISENTGIVSVDPDTSPPPRSAVYNHKMNNGVSSTGIHPRSPGGSSHDSFDMINNLSDASLENIPDSSGDCCALEAKFSAHSGGNPDRELEAGTNPVYYPSLKPKLPISIKDGPCEEAGDVELKYCRKTFVPHPTRIISNGPVTVSGHSFQPTDRDPTQINSNQSEQNGYEVECEADPSSIERTICDSDKDAVYDQDTNCQIASTGIDPRSPVSSKRDTSDVINKTLDIIPGSISDRLNEELTNDSKLPHDVVDHDIDLGVETKPLFAPADDSKLQNGTENDASEVKIRTSGVENDLHTLDATSMQDTSNGDYDYSGAFSRSSRTVGKYVQSNSHLNEDNVQKVECKSEMVSFKLGISASEKSVLFDCDDVASLETSSSCPSGSTLDTSDVEANASDVTLGPLPDALSDESVLVSRFCVPCENHDIELDVETKSPVEPKLKNHVEENKEAARGECKNTHSNGPNAISGDCCQYSSENLAGRSSNDLQNMECALVKGCHVISDAIYFEPDVPSTSDESTEKDVQVKFEVSAGLSDLYPSDEGSAHNQLTVAAIRNDSKTCSENIVCHDSTGTSQPLAPVSDYDRRGSYRSLARLHDFVQNVNDDPCDASGTLRSASKLGKFSVPGGNYPQESGRSEVAVCAVSDVLPDKMQLPRLQGSCSCKRGLEKEVGFSCCKEKLFSCSNKETTGKQTPQ